MIRCYIISLLLFLAAKVYSGQAIDRTDPQVQALLTRLKNAARPEEKEQIFSDLKKMPHLFAAIIKMTNSERSGGDVSFEIVKKTL